MTAVEEKTDTTTGENVGSGRVVRVIGPVVDVEFGRETIPPLNQALTCDIELGELSKTLTLEVAQHIGDDMVRAIALQTVGGLQRDGTDHVVADVLRDLEGERFGELTQLDLRRERVVQLGDAAPAELHVHDGSDDPDDAPSLRAGLGFVVEEGRHASSPDAASASAPPTISLISWVISAWRAWLARRV